MEKKLANEKIIEILTRWDPLNYGEGFYETEVIDVLQAVHVMDNSKGLARKIQAIYEFTSEQIIPLNECEKMALRLLQVKNESSCEI
ncbi:DUF1871 family protein [Metabacillus arenae]|uniref:DUF1871 family protein n=1 Tax=Metabacillus arenae TaxID=2771434 RepID=A0A926RYY8_9BACI|nr:DUF1871 family protein [Metabacillus arenae]MBD1382576.1 DUF1871 family protein [Metabacillus arenae]